MKKLNNNNKKQNKILKPCSSKFISTIKAIKKRQKKKRRKRKEQKESVSIFYNLKSESWYGQVTSYWTNPPTDNNYDSGQH